MIFETELMYLKEKIKNAETLDELNNLRRVNKKKLWWTSIFICGLFYGLNDKVGKMIISWIINPFTFGIYNLYIIYTSYKDEKEFNNQMEIHILKRKKELEEIKVETEKQINFTEEDNLEPESIKITFPKNASSLETYEKQIQELESLYQIKEKIAFELIEKHFPPPQITYDRFIGVINSCNLIFYKQTESSLNIINMTTTYTPKVDAELKKKVDILKSLIEKIDELTNELAINLSNSDEQSYSDEVKDLLDDMKKLIDSVKEYG